MKRYIILFSGYPHTQDEKQIKERHGCIRAFMFSDVYAAVLETGSGISAVVENSIVSILAMNPPASGFIML